jgi:poly-gamma-glutamate capsule biosynthesis protein CapA/YwtB (metallophosphatase superfamily)
LSATGTSDAVVRLAAVGDLLLAPDPAGTPYPRDPALIAPEVRAVLRGCDVVFGNLECTLPGDGRSVAAEPRVIATPELVRAVRAAGFNIVTLANNHTFDCFQPGYENLRGLLKELALPHFGAGMNLDEATAAAIFEAHGLRLAFLGAVDHRSGPYQFAAANQWGVAPLHLDRLTRQIRELRPHVDHVLVSLHWGEERFLIPSPAQVDQAHALVDAGASMVLGHHPHVLQGLEIRRGAPIAYSLGNFIADEVYFTDGDAVRWNRTGRTGCILLAELGPGPAVANVRQVPTYDPGRKVELDHGSFGPRRIAKASRAIARGVTPRRYRREHLWVKTIKPIVQFLRWSNASSELRIPHIPRSCAVIA